LQTRKNPTVWHALRYSGDAPSLVATRIQFVIIRTPRSMMKIGSILRCWLFCLASPVLTAGSDDPANLQSL
jgi:hypothetical protein